MFYCLSTGSFHPSLVLLLQSENDWSHTLKTHCKGLLLWEESLPIVVAWTLMSLNHLISSYQQMWQPDVVGRTQLCLVQTPSLPLVGPSFFLLKWGSPLLLHSAVRRKRWGDVYLGPACMPNSSCWACPGPQLVMDRFLAQAVLQSMSEVQVWIYQDRNMLWEQTQPFWI